MPIEPCVQISPAELIQIVEAVFGTMLGLEPAGCDAPWQPTDDQLTATVHLTGEWNGAVMLQCNRRQAGQFTSRFLSMDAPEEVDEVVRDTLGELANMIGGNLKCVLTPGIRLSMPSVVDGADYSVRPSGAAVRERLAFKCEDGTFWVTALATRT